MATLSTPMMWLLFVVAATYMTQFVDVQSAVDVLPVTAVTEAAAVFVQDLAAVGASPTFALLLKVLGLGVAVVAVRYVLQCLFSPLLHVRKIGEVPVEWANKRNKQHSKAAMHVPRLVDPEVMPPPFPNGWYFVCRSDELQVGDVRDVSMLGMHLVVFRGESGKVGMFDKYCPHLGANLAVGGTVDGDCLRCPFHGWQFSAETGECTSIEYAQPGEKIPKHAAVKCYNLMERNQLLLFWHDAEGREPQWEPVQLEGNFTFHGHSSHEINCHVQECPENGADVAHLGVLHPPSIFGLSFLSHQFDATWTPGKDREGGMKEFAYIDMDEYFKFNGREIPGSRMKVEILQMGPALVQLVFLTPLGRVAMLQTVRPQKAMVQEMQHMIFAEPMVPRWLAKFMLWALVVQVERDIPIWNSKTYQNKPVLGKGDPLILPFRRWFKQFYSENSTDYPTAIANEKQNKTLDW
jgi:cholesterol 7-dehydrogenase